MAEWIFDLETNGLIDEVNVIHCAVAINVETGECLSWKPHEIPQFIEWIKARIKAGDTLIGHNSIGYDEYVLWKLHGIVVPPEQSRDTMVLGKLIHPDIKKSDFTRHKRWKAYKKATDEGLEWTKEIPLEFPGQHIGNHSLAAWGYRMGIHKGDYKGPWDRWSPEMHEYMIQDGRVTLELYKRLMAHEPTEQSVVLEHRTARLCAKMERNGFPFDIGRAVSLLERLVNEREALRLELVALFPSWRVRLPDFVPKRDNKPKGYVKGVPVERWKTIEFNPQSRKHIINRFQAKYNWKPKEWTQEAEVDPVTKEKIQKGSPKMDEEILSKLPYPEAPKLARLFLINKRIGQLSEGSQAWLKVVKNGKIHARYNTNGAVTGRATHSKPNISQVPRLSTEFGRECRELFHVPDSWVLVGADQSGLELRCLSSDMAAFDDGAYGEIVTTGDVHTANQKAAGLKTRDDAKTFIYAFLYGAGNGKIGEIIGKGPKAGGQLRRQFLTKTPALGKLNKFVKKAAERGWIKGIDGRKMPVRSPHAALNTRLQSSGAIICKQWICDLEDALLAKGLKHGWDGDFVFLSWSHDEVQIAARDDPELISIVQQIAIGTGRAAGSPFQFRCALDVETKVGRNWAETH